MEVGQGLEELIATQFLPCPTSTWLFSRGLHNKHSYCTPYSACFLKNYLCYGFSGCDKNTMTISNLGGRGFISLPLPYTADHRRKSGQGPMQRPWRSAAWWCGYHDLLILVYISQDHLPRSGSNHNGPRHPHQSLIQKVHNGLAHMTV